MDCARGGVELEAGAPRPAAGAWSVELEVVAGACCVLGHCTVHSHWPLQTARLHLLVVRYISTLYTLHDIQHTTQLHTSLKGLAPNVPTFHCFGLPWASLGMPVVS